MSLSLLFCPPAFWERSWASLQRAVGVGGHLAVTLFGPNDDWANELGMTFRTPDELRKTLLHWLWAAASTYTWSRSLPAGGHRTSAPFQFVAQP